uniref:Uncharacterized protein n=1 Tax=Opuntia streptacantha TaxID=393608 RepID=A0A7C9D6I4_OPUST
MPAKVPSHTIDSIKQDRGVGDGSGGRPGSTSGGCGGRQGSAGQMKRNRAGRGERDKSARGGGFRVPLTTGARQWFLTRCGGASGPTAWRWMAGGIVESRQKGEKQRQRK